jgi:hypothetical protein
MTDVVVVFSMFYTVLDVVFSIFIRVLSMTNKMTKPVFRRYNRIGDLLLFVMRTWINKPALVIKVLGFRRNGGQLRWSTISMRLISALVPATTTTAQIPTRV